MLRARPATTALSHLGRAERVKASPFAAVARRSQKVALVLLLTSLAALGSSGCIVADPPDYGEPQLTLPNIIGYSVDPPIFFPIRVTTPGDPTNFSMQIQSEDAGERLYIALFVDYGSSQQYFLDDLSHPATSFDKVKPISFDQEFNRVSDGCHTLTMLVMHDSSWNNNANSPDPARFRDDIAVLTWTLYVNVDENEPPACPKPSQSAALP